MCDTIIILGNSTEDGSTIFAKNSDREANEPQGLIYIPREQHNESETVKCTYIEIPQVSETYEVILSVPYWIWGAEMGANEWGVCIGNEAVFSKLNYNKKGLLGMDLLRLALERSKSSKEALNVIISLLEKYGQGGTGSIFDPNFIYHNSFIIADKNEAWVLETMDKFWVAEKVKDIRTISNGYTIKKWDLSSSPNIIDYAIENNLCESKEDFDFVECLSDPVPRGATNCVERQKNTTEFLLNNKGNINVKMVMKLLRSHGKFDNENEFSPSNSGMQVCMHYSSKALSQTTNSMVAHLADINTYWFTGTSAPCISLFKPIFLNEIRLPETYKFPGERYEPGSLWWDHEKLHRLILMDYSNRAKIVQDAYRIETEFIDKIKLIIHEFKNTPDLNKKLKDFSENAFSKQNQILNSLIERISNTPIEGKTSKIYLKKWNKLSKSVGLAI
ncbi:MAG: C69 family dipeptidase [Candidatus Helarchaeota archaeon]